MANYPCYHFLSGALFLTRFVVLYFVIEKQCYLTLIVQKADNSLQNFKRCFSQAILYLEFKD